MYLREPQTTCKCIKFEKVQNQLTLLCRLLRIFSEIIPSYCADYSRSSWISTHPTVQVTPDLLGNQPTLLRRLLQIFLEIFIKHLAIRVPYLPLLTHCYKMNLRHPPVSHCYEINICHAYLTHCYIMNIYGPPLSHCYKLTIHSSLTFIN